VKRVRVIPILLIDNGRAVITRKFNKPVYVGDPINAIRIFNDKEVDEMFILDITAKARRSCPDYELISMMASESFMPIAYGGHVCTMEQAEKIINLGIEKICFNTSLYENPKAIEQVAGRYGSQSVVASIDVKKNWLGNEVIKTFGGKRTIQFSLEEVAEHLKKIYVGEVLLTSIDKDGMMSGYELKLIESFSKLVEVPVVACGGAAGIDDFLMATRAGASAVAAGAMFYFKGGYDSVLINYPDQRTLIEKFYKNL
jgi:cyclase